MRLRNRLALVLAAAVVAGGAHAQPPTAPESDKTAPRMEQPPPHPPPDFRQLPRIDDEQLERRSQQDQEAEGPPPPPELSQAMFLVVQDETAKRIDALTRALIAEAQVKTLRRQLAAVQAAPRPAQPPAADSRPKVP